MHNLVYLGNKLQNIIKREQNRSSYFPMSKPVNNIISFF